MQAPSLTTQDRTVPVVDAREKRLARLSTLLEVASMLSSQHDVSETVRQVLVRAIAAIPACDAGTLYLEDPTTGRLAVQDSVGFGPSIFKLSLKLGEGAAGRAVLSGRGALYNSRDEVLAVIGEASPDTYRYFQEASDGPRAPHAAASAPLIYKGKALGALVVDAFQN
jgi:signal transduction protein with GAF and PtsI domain